MSTEKIDKIAIYVEINGKTYMVRMSHEKLLLGVQVLAGLTDDRQLPVAPAENMEFTSPTLAVSPQQQAQEK